MSIHNFPRWARIRCFLPASRASAKWHHTGKPEHKLDVSSKAPRSWSHPCHALALTQPGNATRLSCSKRTALLRFRSLLTDSLQGLLAMKIISRGCICGSNFRWKQTLHLKLGWQAQCPELRNILKNSSRLFGGSTSNRFQIGASRWLREGKKKKKDAKQGRTLARPATKHNHPSTMIAHCS